MKAQEQCDTASYTQLSAAAGTAKISLKYITRDHPKPEV
jgi:hypothetical protein